MMEVLVMFESLKELLVEENYSGVVTIKKDDEIVFEKAMGFMDRANKITINAETRFGIASGTKLFTALGILKLIEDGRLSLDSKVFDHIKQPFDTYDNRVTIKHLLSHTSGLPDYFDEDLIEDFDNFKVSVPWCELLKPSDYMPVMPDRKMKYPMGEKFHYNNSGFVMLAMVIESITGDYHEWITSSILKPHNLNHTGFYRFDQLPENCAYGYIDLENNQYKTNIYNLPIIGGGDGGIYSNSYDLIKLWELLMNGEIINKKLLDLLLTPHVIDGDDHYGLGVWLDKQKNGFTPAIVGSDPGVSFVSTSRTDLNIVYNVISNTSGDAWKVNKKVLEIISKL